MSIEEAIKIVKRKIDWQRTGTVYKYEELNPELLNIAMQVLIEVIEADNESIN